MAGIYANEPVALGELRGSRLRGDDAGGGMPSVYARYEGVSMTLKIDGTLLLAGAGNMGLALLAGWRGGGPDAKQLIVQAPSPPPRGKELLGKHGIVAQSAVASLPQPPAVIVVAV